MKHAQPVLDASVPPREWVLGDDGEAESRELAARLKAFAPFALVSSREPKALQTAHIVAEELGIPADAIEGLEEIDRPAQPILPHDQHERLNARIFDVRAAAVAGRESANDALERFTGAVARAISMTRNDHNLVVITHGTVIALFVEQQTGRDAFSLWRSLRCGGHVTVATPLRPARAGDMS